MGCDYYLNPPGQGIRRIIESKAIRLYKSVIRQIRNRSSGTVSVIVPALEWDEFIKANRDLENLK